MSHHELGIALAIGIAVFSCQTPAILDPHTPPGQCNQYTEHKCNGPGAGCCLLEWVCGGVQYANEPARCPEGMCCDENAPPDDLGAKRRTMHQRRP